MYIHGGLFIYIIYIYIHSYMVTYLTARSMDNFKFVCIPVRSIHNKIRNRTLQRTNHCIDRLYFLRHFRSTTGMPHLKV